MPIYNHDNYLSLNTEVRLWRYLDFFKFKSLLETKSLFFCRADKFSDPFEGSLPKKEAECRIKTFKDQAFYFQQTFDKDSALKNIIEIQNLHKRFKRGVVVNCWQINETESDAMWRLYLKDNEGVAIQTTTQKMIKTIKNTNEEIGISKVRYLNYENDVWYHAIDYPHTSYNFIIPFIHKRIEFKYESELRLFIQIQEAIDNENYWDNEKIEKGKLIPIEIDLLIDKIYLPPTIDQKATDKIIGLSKSFGYNFEFVKSKLTCEPFYY